MIFTRVRVRATLDERLVYIAQSSTAMTRIQILFLTDFSHRVDFNTTPYTGQYSQPVMVVAKRGSSFDPSWNRAGSRNSTLVRTPFVRLLRGVSRHVFRAIEHPIHGAPHGQVQQGLGHAFCRNTISTSAPAACVCARRGTLISPA